MRKQGIKPVKVSNWKEKVELLRTRVYNRQVRNNIVALYYIEMRGAY